MLSLREEVGVAIGLGGEGGGEEYSTKHSIIVIDHEN